MRVTLTGGTGFLGSFLARDLLAKGATVRIMARPSPHAGVMRLAGAEIMAGNLADAASIARAVEGADVVYHLAAKKSGPNRDEYFKTNVAGTQRVLAACAQKGVHQLVYLSSLAVFGPVDEGQRIDDDSPLDSQPELRDPYSESKIAAERAIDEFATSSRMAITVIRPGIIFGPGRPLPIALFGFRRGYKNYVFGNPAHRFPLNYAENLVDALQAGVARPGAVRRYNVVDDDDLTLGRYHEIKSATDNTSTRFCPDWLLYMGSPITEMLRKWVDMGDTRLSRHQLRRALQDRWYDTKCIREETGWHPRVSLAEALHRTVRVSSHS